MSNEFLGGYTQGWFDSIKESRDLIYQYNNSHPHKLKERYDILNKLLGSVTEDCIIEPPFRCDNGKNLFLGKHFYANYNFVVLDYDKIIIGDNVKIGPNVVLCSATHPLEAKIRCSGTEASTYGKPINIKNNVWIGANAVVNCGVTIGANSIVGAGSIVLKDVPDNVVVAGCPAKIIKYL